MTGNMIKFRSGELTRIKTNMPLKMLITNTKVGRNTKTLVAGVSERTLKHPNAMSSVFNAVDSISNEVASIILAPVSDDLAITEKEEKLEELMEMNQGLLQCMGVSHASIETVIRTTLKYKLSSKLTGAGGGGCVLTLLPTCILLNGSISTYCLFFSSSYYLFYTTLCKFLVVSVFFCLMLADTDMEYYVSLLNPILNATEGRMYREEKSRYERLI